MADFNPSARTVPTTITTSFRGPESHNTARVVVDMEDQILLYQPEATPLMTLTAKMRKKRKRGSAGREKRNILPGEK